MRQRTQTGFTIVELLIVIVVIGILAAITIVAFNGVQQSAAVASLQSDLRNAQSQIRIEKEVEGSYPVDDSELAASAGTNYEYDYDTDSFCITASSDAAGTSFFFDSTTNVIEEGTCPGHSGIAAGPLVSIVSAGTNHTCTLYDSTPYCWGLGANGRLGQNSVSDSLEPIPVLTSGVLSGRTVTAIDAGGLHTCAIAESEAYCWGYGLYGRLGQNSVSDSIEPIPVLTSGVLSGRTVTAIDAGINSTCAIADGLAFCWGFNGTGGALGNNSTADSLVPVAVSTAGVLSGRIITDITVGGNHACAIADGLAFCWGRNSNWGQLGVGSFTDSRVPVAVTTAGVLSGRTVTSIAGSYDHNCAIADGLAFCWGHGGNGRLGNGATSASTIPVAVSTAGVLNGRTISAIAAGGGHSCAITDGEVFCWGQAGWGQLGNGSTTSVSTPVAVDTSGVLSGKTVTEVTTGFRHTCVVADGDAFCWGQATSGELGNGIAIDSTTPVAVSPFPSL